MKIHRLKIKKQYYLDIRDYGKKFEVRKNDRDYEVGDILCLSSFPYRKFEPSLKRKITYILKDFTGLDKDYVILGIENLSFFDFLFFRKKLKIESQEPPEDVPKKIYLVFPENGVSDNFDSEGVTWTDERINDNDIEYVYNYSGNSDE